MFALTDDDGHRIRRSHEDNTVQLRDLTVVRTQNTRDAKKQDGVGCVVTDARVVFLQLVDERTEFPGAIFIFEGGKLARAGLKVSQLPV